VAHALHTLVEATRKECVFYDNLNRRVWKTYNFINDNFCDWDIKI